MSADGQIPPGIWNCIAAIMNANQMNGKSSNNYPQKNPTGQTLLVCADAVGKFIVSIQNSTRDFQLSSLLYTQNVSHLRFFLIVTNVSQ